MLPVIAAGPMAKEVLGSGSHAGAMEMGVSEPGASRDAHEMGARAGAPIEGGDPRALLVPPPPLPHAPGRVRELELVAEDRTIEVAKGVRFDAFAYNGTVPGPVIRVTEDDVLRVLFTNHSSHPHSIHFHGTHRSRMDGSLEPVQPGSSFIYELRARPYGMQLYHCHTRPLARHLAGGLYGAMIVDPPRRRPAAQEFVLVLSGLDLDGDGANELFAFNGRPFYYDRHPIRVRLGRTVRLYLANVTEYEPVASFHLHGEFFRLYRTGTTEQFEYTDTVTLGQGERCVVEIDFHERGLYMFHGHQSRMAENGLSGWFQVVDGDEPVTAETGLLGLYADQFADCTPCLGDLGAKALLKY
jgi:manganese oxidase